MSSLSRCPRCLLNKITRYNKSDRLFSGSSTKRQETVAHTSRKGDVIYLPKRIPRSPTAILDTLASTVQRDCYGPPYKYIDDPQAFPTSKRDKQAFSLAKAAGQRAAQFVVNRWPQSFVTNPMDPTVEMPDAFKPFIGSQQPADTEEGLRERIELRQITEAYDSYQKNKQAGTELSPDTMHDLLDLLCVHNSTEPEVLLEEEAVFLTESVPTTQGYRFKNTWKDEGPAEAVFSDMKNPTEHAYCSLIKGRAKYHQLDQAIQLFNEMRQNGMKPGMRTYCAVLTARLLSAQQVEQKITAVKELFQTMNDQGLQPNLEMFNRAFLEIGTSVRTSAPSAAHFCSKLLAEMNVCGVEPSLATWYYIMRIYYRDNDSQSGILYQIMDILDGKDVTIECADDLKFFSLAMTKGSVNLKDLELSYRINDLLNFNNNYQLIGDNFSEAVYYKFFFKTLCMFEQIETIMEYYDKAVPNWFSPLPPSILDLVEALKLNEGYGYLPKIWTDMFGLKYEKFPNIMGKLCELMARKKHDEQLQKQCHDLMCGFYENMHYEVMMLEERGTLDRSSNIAMIDAPLMGHMCVVCLNSGDTAKAREIFSFFLRYKNMILGMMKERDLTRLVDLFIEEKDFMHSVDVLKLMSENGYKSTDQTAEKIKSLLDVSPDQEHIVNALL